MSYLASLAFDIHWFKSLIWLSESSVCVYAHIGIKWKLAYFLRMEFLLFKFWIYFSISPPSSDWASIKHCSTISFSFNVRQISYKELAKIGCLTTLEISQVGVGIS